VSGKNKSFHFSLPTQILKAPRMCLVFFAP
jgi:hypothetical protein